MNEAENVGQATLTAPGYTAGRKPFPVRAAKLSLLCSLFGLAILILFSVIEGDHGLNEGRMLVFLVFVTCALLVWATGIGLGVMALRGIRQWGAKGILVRAILGILFNLCLAVPVLAVTILGSRNLATLAAEQRKLAANEADIVKARVGDGPAMEKVLVGYANGALAKYSQDMTRQYKEAGRFLTNGPVLDMALIHTREELQGREMVVREFMEASAKLRDYPTEAHRLYEDELAKHKIPQAIQAEHLKEFDQGVNENIAISRDLRRAEEKFGVAVLAALGYLEKNWGKWEFLSATQQLRFTPASMGAEFEQKAKQVRTATFELIRQQNRMRLTTMKP